MSASTDSETVKRQNSISLRIHEPLGSWPMDRYFKDIDTSQSINLAPISSIYLMEERYAAKFYGGGTFAEDEMKKMLLSGLECAVQPVRRIFSRDDEYINGFVEPLERGLTTGAPNFDEEVDRKHPNALWKPFRRLPLSREQKRDVIHQLCRLVDRLHSKGIVHGDIKTSNLLLCGNDELRLCDFMTAVLEADKENSGFFSVHYSSPFRMRDVGYYSEPVTKADDLYAVGVSIWEIWTEIFPFSDLPLDDLELEDAITSGLRPDITAVDDPEIASLITKYLDSGPKLSNTHYQPVNICIELYGIAFLECKASPPHTYSQFSRCCRTDKPGEENHYCLNPVRIPQTPTSVPIVLICPRCNMIEYRGV